VLFLELGRTPDGGGTPRRVAAELGMPAGPFPGRSVKSAGRLPVSLEHARHPVENGAGGESSRLEVTYVAKTLRFELEQS
jgi:hypothetical protein